MIACSGPDAGATIARNADIGNINGGVAVGICLCSIALYTLWRRGWGFPAAQVAIASFHPAWTISAIGGDCGYLLRDASYVATTVAGLVLIAPGAYSARTYFRRFRSDLAGDDGEGPDGAMLDGHLPNQSEKA